MLKVRLMGSKKDIKRFLQLMLKSKELELIDYSKVFTLKGTTKFFRCYTEVELMEKKKAN